MADKENKSAKKAEKKTSSGNNSTFVRGILGIVLLLVFGSIAFSTVVIWGGTDTLGPKIVTAPAALFDVFIAFVAFSKILK
jgi:hypothetical protein